MFKIAYEPLVREKLHYMSSVIKPILLQARSRQGLIEYFNVNYVNVLN